jgi:proteasome accessory factor A
MSVMRLMGIETEYAISSDVATSRRTGKMPPRKDNPIELSYELVRAAAKQVPMPVRWDYRPEDPVNDARGYRLQRASARPEMLTDVPELRPTNVVAINGGRIYVDHAHPEYSSPEVMTPRAALAADRIGDVLMEEAATKASETMGRRVRLHRNNTDGKGSSWGAHESYQVKRSVPFARLAALMELHFVTRQIYTGAGRVGVGEGSDSAAGAQAHSAAQQNTATGLTSGFQISQRADYFHERIGLQTTFDRPIINTRDESHSTEEYRRLHVIVGDANRMDVPELLKLGTTSMLAWLAENAAAADFDLEGFLAEHALADPVAALHGISHNLGLERDWETLSGSHATAWQLQVALRSAVYMAGAAVHGTDSTGEPLWPDADTREIMELWGAVLAVLARLRHETDDERLADTDAARYLEWLLKWQVLEGLRRRKGAQWSAPLLAAVDLSWAECSASSVFAKVGSRALRIATDADIDAARSAPEETRAWFRARVIEKFPSAVAAASWKQLALRTHTGRIATLDISDSERFSRVAAEVTLERAQSVETLLEDFATGGDSPTPSPTMGSRLLQ